MHLYLLIGKTEDVPVKINRVGSVELGLVGLVGSVIRLGLAAVTLTISLIVVITVAWNCAVSEATSSVLPCFASSAARQMRHVLG